VEQLLLSFQCVVGFTWLISPIATSTSCANDVETHALALRTGCVRIVYYYISHCLAFAHAPPAPRYMCTDAMLDDLKRYACPFMLTSNFACPYGFTALCGTHSSAVDCDQCLADKHTAHELVGPNYACTGADMTILRTACNAVPKGLIGAPDQLDHGRAGTSN
jgi:hypothetical protein